MSALVPTAATRPAPLGAERHLRLAVIANVLETAGGQLVLAADRAPSAAERAVYARHRDALDAALRPAGKGVTLQLFTELLLVMSARGGDREEAAARAVRYVNAWKDVPLFALNQACDDFVQGVVGDGKWLPEPGVLYGHAGSYWRQAVAERAKLARVLDARVLPSVDRGTAADRKAAVARILAATRGEDVAPAPVAAAQPVPVATTPIALSPTLASSPAFARTLGEQAFAEVPGTPATFGSEPAKVPSAVQEASAQPRRRGTKRRGT